MVNASIVTHPHAEWLNNGFFSGEPTFGFKSDIYHFKILKDRLLELGINLATHDLNTVEDALIVFCFDAAEVKFVKKANQIIYLIIHDMPLYNNQNWCLYNHVGYDKVFIWDSSVTDKKKYFHYTLPINLEDYPVPVEVTEKEFKNKKFCVTVSSSNTVDEYAPLTTLSRERFNILKWFAENHPQDCVLYGRGWSEKLTYFKGRSVLKKFLPEKMISKIGKHASKNHLFSRIFGGQLNPLGKVNKLKEFKFYICYENTAAFSGWITEKIFECFAASCIPIYLGHEDVEEFIPSGCFINRRKFNTHEELYNFLKNMSFEEYSSYIKNIIQFWQSQEIQKFKASSFAETIIEHLEEDLKAKNLIPYGF